MQFLILDIKNKHCYDLELVVNSETLVSDLYSLVRSDKKINVDERPFELRTGVGDCLVLEMHPLRKYFGTDSDDRILLTIVYTHSDTHSESETDSDMPDLVQNSDTCNNCRSNCDTCDTCDTCSSTYDTHDYESGSEYDSDDSKDCPLRSQFEKYLGCPLLKSLESFLQCPVHKFIEPLGLDPLFKDFKDFKDFIPLLLSVLAEEKRKGDEKKRKLELVNHAEKCFILTSLAIMAVSSIVIAFK